MKKIQEKTSDVGTTSQKTKISDSADTTSQEQLPKDHVLEMLLMHEQILLVNHIISLFSNPASISAQPGCCFPPDG